MKMPNFNVRAHSRKSKKKNRRGRLEVEHWVNGAVAYAGMPNGHGGLHMQSTGHVAAGAKFATLANL